MSAPLYFLPGITQAQLVSAGKLNRSILESRGLAIQFADVFAVPEEAVLIELAGAGPGGSSGCILTALPPSREPPLRLGYYPEWQNWIEDAGPGEPVWIGIDKEHLPTPAELSRGKQFGGYPITLANQEWNVPIIRDPVGGTALPRHWLAGADGSVSERIKDAYVALWDGFASVVDLFYDADNPTPANTFSMDRAEAMRHCLNVLGLNYRVGRIEQNLLGIVDADNWQTILAAAVDLWGFWEVHRRAQEKKSARDAGRSASVQTPTDVSSGLQADATGINQAVATS